MHPCCWGNMLQGMVQMVPFLAIFAVAAKKLWDARLQFALRKKNLQAVVQTQAPCCCPRATESIEHPVGKLG